MKILPSITLLTAVSSANAFSTVSRSISVSFSSARCMSSEGSNVVPESAMPDANPYARIGISEDEMALGIDAAEFLQWIGTKQELVDKFLRDNKGMDEAEAEKEVSKFFMDADMVNAYIKFERDKIENPPDYRAEAEQTLSDPKTIATYAAWLIGGASFGYVRKQIIEPKFASGEWEEIHISLPGFAKTEEAAEAASSLVSAISAVDTGAVVDSVQSMVDTAVSTTV